MRYSCRVILSEDSLALTVIEHRHELSDPLSCIWDMMSFRSQGLRVGQHWLHTQVRKIPQTS